MLNASPPTDGKPIGVGRPADECPFPRPFPEGFDQCPTVGRSHLPPLDMSDRPLAHMLTCRHLGDAVANNGKVGWYAARKLGDQAARRKRAAVGIN